MPFKNKNGKNNKRINYNRGKYKKSYNSRFKDKKINTAIEKKIKDIAEAEDRKAIEYYVVRGTYLMPAQQYPIDDTYPTLAQSITLAPNAHFYREMSKIGGYLSTDLASSGAAIPPAYGGEDMAINLHIKQMKFYIRVLNQSASGTAATVDIRIFRVPFNKRYLAQSVLPDALSRPVPQLGWLTPFVPFNKMTPECVDLFKQSLAATGTSGGAGLQNPRNIRYTQVTGTRFRVPYGRMVDDPAGGAANVRINTELWVEKIVSKTYAGLGFKEPYEFESLAGAAANTIIGNPSKHIYYMSIKSDQQIAFQAATSVKFCRGSAQASQLVFDRLAPGAQ